MICDPGGEIYTARTFSSRRYDSQVLNSYGNAVPVIGGRLQRTGAEARAIVRRADFTDQEDTLTLDIRSAYDVTPDRDALDVGVAHEHGEVVLVLGLLFGVVRLVDVVLGDVDPQARRAGDLVDVCFKSGCR